MQHGGGHAVGAWEVDENYRRQLEAACTGCHVGVYGEASFAVPAVPDSPRVRRRQCTDLSCAGLLAAFVYGLWAIYSVSKEHGNLDKLTHGYDWKGDICGVDLSVQDSGLLYWCAPGTASPMGLDLLDAICVPRCPTGPETASWCPGEAKRYGHWEDQASNTKEVVIGTVRNLTIRADYPTVEAFGYCFPKQDIKLLGRIMQETHVSSATKQVFLACHGAVESWRFLICVALACTCVGYAFLGVLWFCFSKVVHGLIVGCHLLLLACCGASSYACVHQELNFFTNYFEPHSARTCMWSCTGLAWAVWLLFLAFCCCNRSAIRTTVDSVRQTCEVIAEVPSLLLQPFLHSSAVLSSLLCLLYGFAWLLSTGQVVPDTLPAQEGGLEVEGLQRSIRFAGWQWACIGYWVFGIMWVVETMHALGQFAISHAVVVRTCIGVSEPFPLLHGYSAGIVFHLGTLAFGGFIVSCLKFVVILLSFLVRQTSDESGAPSLVGRIVCCCCISSVACVERVLIMVNDLIYTDVALRGAGYVDAANNVVRVGATNPGAYVALKGSVVAVRMLGVSIIGGLGTLLSYQVLASTPLHDSVDTIFPSASSMLVTSSILGTTVASGVICLLIGKAFMTVFCQTTHTLMYSKLIGVTDNGDEEQPCSSRSLLLQ